MNEPIYSYSLRLLTARDYPIEGLRDKIKKKFPSAEKEEIQEVLDDLTKKNYLNDSRTAENFIRYRKEYFPRGARMIEQELWKKKFSEEIISIALKENFSSKDEINCCRILGEKKYPFLLQKEEDIFKRKEKFTRYLASKGFGFGTIDQIWAECIRSRV